MINDNMEKPKSVRTIGLIVSIFSGFIIFSNGMGALVFTLLGFGSENSEQPVISEFNLIDFLLTNLSYVCLVMVAIGVLCLIAGLNIRKYKLWANRLLTYLSSLLIVLIWTFMLTLFSIITGQQEMVLFALITILTALFWSTPIGLLIWFLNTEKIKKHFT